MIDENVANRAPTKVAKGKGKTIEEIYTKKTQLEHILLRPDTYIGSVEKQTQSLWVLDPTTKRIVNRSVVFVPGLYKIFDEIIVNAADNKQRDPTMSRIDVTIDQEEGSIRVWNNGSGIPVVIHAEHHIYVPELIFGHLLTGSNFDDEEQKTTGGRNGYGSKLANIFSKKFIVETSDSTTRQKFKQEFTNNMSSRSQPIVTPSSSTDFTCVTFFPDLKRFKMDTLDDDIVALMSKRVYDMAGTVLSTGAKLSVYLNGSRIEARNFEQYISLYDGLQPNIAFERVNERWEIGVGVSDGSFQQVSFVNSISTTKGGCHVNYIADQVTSKLVGVIKKRNKGVEVKPNQIKNHLAVFVNALVVNPAFDSQTKENLTTKASSFGSTCTLSDKLMKTVEKSGIVENILNWAKFKQTAELKKKNGAKKNKILGITKLDDANFAGTAKSRDCSLILTEGDSAKTLAISGLSIVGRDYYGVFPLKGKLLNVREASHAQIMKNEEIQNVVTILGLQFGKVYEDTSSLRYGHLLIMTDQDQDGSHIKGLLINFIHHFWPSLLKLQGFLQQFITPIVKCSRGHKEMTFFTLPQYHMWKEANRDGKGWKIKYYKGLGTSTAAEAKEYFSDLPKHKIDFIWDDKADDMIDMAFAKKRVEDRKFWLLGNEAGTFMDYNVENVSYDTFVNKELILFSVADNERSIPHYMDGLKPSQRKVLFGCFKRNLKNETKVAQLAGYISEQSAYHHGEASLTQTIIGMAQNFVGSNNINLLAPCGQFGTRLMGGKDAASPRYVFTRLEKITRAIFHPLDDHLLNYLDDDGQSIEPSFYVPIIPMVLVNGSEGIGTGWSTSITTYNPRDIVTCLRQMISGEGPTELHPWYRGFEGEIQAKPGATNTPTYIVSGRVEVVDDSTIVVSELPIGKWTSEYKQFLESAIIGGPAATAANKEEGTQPVAPFIKDFKENHTDTTVLFTITIPPEKLVEILNEKGGLNKKLKLDTTVSTSNMHMFDNHGVIKKFDGPIDVINAFYSVRIEFYAKRKNHLMKKFTEEWEMLDNKVRFIQAVIDGKIIVSNRKKGELLNDLARLKFKLFVDNSQNETTASEADTTDADSNAVSGDLERGYDYLLSMKIWSLTQEKITELLKLRDEKKADLNNLASKTNEDLWLQDLNVLEAELDEFERQIVEASKLEAKHRKNAQASRAIGKKRAIVAKKRVDSDVDDDDEDDSFIESDDGSDFEAKKKTKALKPSAPKRPVLAEKPVPTSKPPAVSKPAATSSASATKSVTNAITKPLTSITSVATSRDEPSDSEAPMSLLERIKMKQLASGFSVTSLTSSSISSIQSVAAASKPVAKKPAATKPVAPKKAVVNLVDSSDDDGEDNDDNFSEKPVASNHTAPVRTTRPKAAKKTHYSDDESQDFDDDVFSVEDSDEDFDEDDATPVKKAPVKKVPTIKTAPVKASAPKAENKGVKRAPKGTTKSSEASDLYSPVKASPDTKKKPRKADTSAKPASSKPAAGSKPGPSSKAPVAPKLSKLVSNKSKKVDSDEEDIDFDEPIIKKSPKPVRQRKPTSYAVYDESEEEEDSFIVDDDEEEESDFDE